ncbi:unnamed protein product [Allacma fusca]|uniref:C2H2-type domain-containing protein n=1 Tax=Allacma fusca TaxID=39272 RepID=A0A8J2JYR2_9HEXA|nr:unnamed protein product [Allacma fusca]
MRERSGTECTESRHDLGAEPIVVLEEVGNDTASVSGESSFDEEFIPSDDASSDEDYDNAPIRKKLRMEKRVIPARPKRKVTLSPIPEDLRSKHQLKDVVVKVERLSASNAVSNAKPRSRRKGLKYKKSRECRHCEMEFSTSAELKKHKKLHKSKGPKDVPCKVPGCSVLFENAAERNAHIKETHPDFKPFQCKFCLRSFTAKQTLKDHENSHTNATPYSCTECGKTFINRSRLHRHMRKHGGRRNFLCDKCEKAFFTIQDLERHVRVHTNERPFICEFCGRSFTAAIYLRDHLPSHPESNLAKPLCKFCGKVFVSSVYLVDHEKTHVGDFKFWCDKCNFGATKKFKLDRHMLTHIETREFECEPCQKKYKSSLDLKTHNKLVHSNMDFVCSTCNKVFTSRFYLLRHTKIHTAEKNFSCSICGYSFSVKRYLRVHMKKYHPQESSLKPIETVYNTGDPEPSNEFVNDLNTEVQVPYESENFI